MAVYNVKQDISMDSITNTIQSMKDQLCQLDKQKQDAAKERSRLEHELRRWSIKIEAVTTELHKYQEEDIHWNQKENGSKQDLDDLCALLHKLHVTTDDSENLVTEKTKEMDKFIKQVDEECQKVPRYLNFGSLTKEQTENGRLTQLQNHRDTLHKLQHEINAYKLPWSEMNSVT